VSVNDGKQVPKAFLIRAAELDLMFELAFELDCAAQLGFCLQFRWQIILGPAALRSNAVVTSVYKNATGMPEAAVLYTDGRTSAWTDAPGAISGFHSRVWEGCDTNLDALRKFADGLK
jgi:hypothetical protein